MKFKLILASFFILPCISFSTEKKLDRRPNIAGTVEFIGCWNSTQLGVVNGENTFVISRGKDSLWLKPNNSKGVRAVLSYAALAPVKGWNICVSGVTGDESIQVTEAFICTLDTTTSSCDAGATIANSKMSK